MVRPILINGKFVKAKSNTAIDVHNPATLESLDSVPSCGEADINAAVEAARAAQKSWWRLSGVEKAELMHGVARAYPREVEGNRDHDDAGDGQAADRVDRLREVGGRSVRLFRRGRARCPGPYGCARAPSTR